MEGLGRPQQRKRKGKKSQRKGKMERMEKAIPYLQTPLYLSEFPEKKPANKKKAQIQGGSVIKDCLGKNGRTGEAPAKKKKRKEKPKERKNGKDRKGNSLITDPLYLDRGGPSKGEKERKAKGKEKWKGLKRQFLHYIPPCI